MEPLTGIDLLDLDDTAFSPTYCVDGVNAEPAIVNEPGHDQLCHYLPSGWAMRTLFGRGEEQCKNPWSKFKSFVDRQVHSALLRG
jgi:hypothetical protein